MEIVTKSKPYQSPHGPITYEYLSQVKPNEQGLHVITAYWAVDDFYEYDPPILLKLVDTDEYENDGNGD